MKFNSFNLFHLLSPFANEFANLITISGVANLYPHKPEGYLDLLKIYTFAEEVFIQVEGFHFVYFQLK